MPSWRSLQLKNWSLAAALWVIWQWRQCHDSDDALGPMVTFGTVCPSCLARCSSHYVRVFYEQNIRDVNLYKSGGEDVDARIFDPYTNISPFGIERQRLPYFRICSSPPVSASWSRRRALSCSILYTLANLEPPIILPADRQNIGLFAITGMTPISVLSKSKYKHAGSYASTNVHPTTCSKRLYYLN